VSNKGRIVVQQARLDHHSGPLPPPEQFAGYEAILSGAAERILRMAEREQEHRHRQEDRIVTGAIRTTYAGQAISASLGAIVCGGGIFAIIQGQAIGGAVAVVAALASIVIAFVTGRKAEAKTPPPAAAS
jgi:uncharacterized membrane protein